MSCGQLVPSHENALVGDLDSPFSGVLGGAPLKVKDIVCDIFPVHAEVGRRVQLFVDFALFLLEFGAGGPTRGQSPSPLRGVEEELMDLLARVKSSNLAAAVDTDPVNSSGA